MAVEGRLWSLPQGGNAGPTSGLNPQSGRPHWILTVCMAVIGRPGLCGAACEVWVSSVTSISWVPGCF